MAAACAHGLHGASHMGAVFRPAGADLGRDRKLRLGFGGLRGVFCGDCGGEERSVSSKGCTLLEPLEVSVDCRLAEDAQENRPKEPQEEGLNSLFREFTEMVRLSVDVGDESRSTLSFCCLRCLVCARDARRDGDRAGEKTGKGV